MIINTLVTLGWALSIYFMVVYSYNVLVSLFGFKNLKKDYDIVEDKTKFLIMVASHNEEKVIRATIQNLKGINYDSGLFDICIVSDNSTDRTTEIAKEENVLVVDTIQGRFPREGVGKPAGIQYALRELGFDNIKDTYDLVMVLDADNFVDPNILKEVNSQYIHEGNPEVIQTYLDSKNYTSIISLSYSVVFWMMNRFNQSSRHRLGLPGSIGGTGFFVNTDWLINYGGFKFKSLTEDLEMEIEIVKHNGRIVWNNFTGIYDEKPENTKTSMKQRHRWAKGHFYVAYKQLFPLIWCFLKTGKLKYIDKILFLMSMGKAIHIVIMVLLLALQLYNNQVTTGAIETINHYFLYISGVNLFLIIYSFMLLPIYSTMRKVNLNRPIKIILGLQWFMLTDFVCQVHALFTSHKQNKWVVTPHNKTEIEEDIEEKKIAA